MSLGKLIDITASPVKELLPVLLQDKSTKKNIIWATDAYAELGAGYDDKNIITPELLSEEFVLQPRISKSLEEQQARTRKKAEVNIFPHDHRRWKCAGKSTYVCHFKENAGL